MGAEEAKTGNFLNGIRETKLTNGLRILTKEVHAAPVVHFAVYYDVGSVNEEVGQTGMSHLMEHMMFKGTKTRGVGKIDEELQGVGADFNASTFFDRTEYHETLPAEKLELAMTIEADRMVNSLYDEAQHQKEMTVVRSEYEAGENDPGTVLDKAVRASAYQIHPYRWDTIGYRADIERFTRPEMYAYYQNYYTPNNAVVVIVGDFKTANAIAQAQKHFGKLQSRVVHRHFITPEPSQEGERRVTVSRAGTVPLVEIAYHIPAFGNPDRYALDILETVLSSGRTGRFFQNIVQTGLAASAGASDDSLRDPDLCALTATAQPGHSPEELERGLLSEVEKLQTTPITGDELARAKNQAEAAYAFGKESVEAQGEELGENAMRGDWKAGELYLGRLRKVTAADVQRVAKAYLTQTNRTVGSFVPTGYTAPTPSSFAPTPASPPLPRVAGEGLLTSPSTLDREAGEIFIGPSPAARGRGGEAGVGAAVPTKPIRTILPNGLTLIIQENHATPTVSVSGALLSAGGVFDPSNQRGLADLTASQLSRGTTTRSLLDIAQTLENVGAAVSVSGGDEYATLSGRALSRDFETLLDVLADELRHPAFPEGELEKSRAQELAGIEEARQETGTLAAIAFDDALFPAGHPYHAPTLDEQAVVVKSLTRDDLLAFHAAHYAPNRLILTVVGDVKASDVLAAVKRRFGDWAAVPNLPSVSIPATPLPAGPTRPRVIFVPDKAQADVFYGWPGQLTRGNPDWYSVVVLDTILGGGSGLGSRLAFNVRDTMGLVYGIGAGTSATLGAGPFSVEFGANPANVDKAIGEMDRQIGKLREKGVTAKEVKDTISYLTGAYAVTLSTNGAVAAELLKAQIYGLGLDYIQKRNGKFRAVTTAQVNAAAKKYLHPGLGALVIAGTYAGKYAVPNITTNAGPIRR